MLTDFILNLITICLMRKFNQQLFSWRRMKRQLALVVAICFVCTIPIEAFALVHQITIKRVNVSIQSVINELEHKSGFTFFYNNNQVKLDKKISINATDQPIEKILDQIFYNSGYTYKIQENQIIVSLNQTTNNSVQDNYQQQQVKKIKGKVVDANGEPIIGASVLEKGKSENGTITDIEGNFELSTGSREIQVSYIGYITQTIEIKSGTSNYKIILNEDNKTLDEVVIVGYSTQKKESLTGALQTIKSDKLKDATTPSVENLLNSKIPGVYVAPGSGKPGANGAIVIRGQASLSGNMSPLWVIDGVIVGSAPGEINPSDVESMTVLKDAASTAIYGSQGANGVIVVTTKRPKIDKLSVNLSAKVGVNQLNNGNLKMMNGQELYDYYSSFANVKEIAFPRWKPELRNSNFDWWKLATRSGFTQDYNLSVQGGSEQLQAFMSIGYYNEEGAVKGYDYSRYNFLFKTIYSPNKWLKIRPTLSGSRRDINDREYSVTSMYSMLPWDSPYDKNGNLVPHRYEGWVNSASTNYLYDLQWDHGASRNYEFMGNLDFDVKINDWLTFASVNNYKYTGYSSNSYTDPRSSGGENVKGRLAEYRWDVVRRYTSQILRFNKSFGKHAINGLAAYEFNDYNEKILDVYGTGLMPGFEVLDVVSKPERTKGNIKEWALQSFLTNANYSYDDKYLAQLSFRRDGASNFGDNAKYGNFFSISGGWNIHREKWFDFKAIDLMKLRVSYGSVGNRPSSLYPQYDLYSVSASYNSNSGALISQKGNNNFTWEMTYTTGVGLDMNMWNNRLRMNFDFYIKNTDNIIYAVPVSGLTGVTYIYKNIGEMKNIGVELSLGGDLIRTKDLTWSVDLNMGHNKNELKKLFKSKNANGEYQVRPIIISDGTNIAGTAQRVLEPGFPVDTYYLKEWAGVNPDNGLPMWWVETKDEKTNTVKRTTTSKYAEATYTKCGKASPNLFGGISTFLSWKNLDVTANFGYSLGGQIYNYSRQEYDSDGTYCDRNQMKLKDGWKRWENPGDIATHPIARYNNQDKGNSTSSRYLESSDFFKMRTLTIAYNLKMNKYNINNIRLFFTGENLFTITDYSGVDPEIPASDEGAVLGTAGPSVYPATRKFMFGFNLSF